MKNKFFPFILLISIICSCSNNIQNKKCIEFASKEGFPIYISCTLQEIIFATNNENMVERVTLNIEDQEVIFFLNAFLDDIREKKMILNMYCGKILITSSTYIKMDQETKYLAFNIDGLTEEQIECLKSATKRYHFLKDDN